MTVFCSGQIHRLMRTGMGLLLAAGICLFSFLPVCAQNVPVPKFFGLNERSDRPDLASLSRLRFLTTVDFPPFNYINRNGDLAGYNIDLIRALCSELKVEDLCQVEAVPWDELVERLRDGGGEAIIAGLAPTAENRTELAFSRPYLRFPARFVSLRETVPGQPFSVWLRSQRVGVIAGTAHEKMLSSYFPDSDRPGSDRLDSGRPDSRRVVFADSEQLYQALRSKSVDVVFGDGMVFSLWLGNPQSAHCCKFVGGFYTGIGYLGEGMRIAVSGENVRLALAIDYAMQLLERKGKLAELYLRYFPIGFY